MLLLVKLVSILIMTFGLLVLFLPQLAKRMLSFWAEGKRVYFAGGIRILIGLLLIGAASESALPQAVLALGLFFVIAGVLVFVISLERLKMMLVWWLEAPLTVCRVLGILVASFGALMFFLL